MSLTLTRWNLHCETSMNREKRKISVFWFRRDLRIDDNAGLHRALKHSKTVLCLFIFDKNILNGLQSDDSRVSFIHQRVDYINNVLKQHNSSLLILHDTPARAWETVLSKYDVEQVFANDDYEPYARQRDQLLARVLGIRGIQLILVKDHVVLDHTEVRKKDGKSYTVFTPYKNEWLKVFKPDSHLNTYDSKKYFNSLLKTSYVPTCSLNDLGFQRARFEIPSLAYIPKIETYGSDRDFPAVDGTTKIGIHLRFGSVSIREVTRAALEASDKTFLNELIWREFYAMVLAEYPETVTSSFKREYDNISWRNNEEEFKAWCDGKTGFPIVDAGMRQLNQTGWMHNRLRMITASFLTKHLLIDWRWGESYFAALLLDYEQSSNIGGWQWAASSGTDAVPYFRIFNPDLQTKKFDPHLKFIREWVPEYADPFSYPKPIVDHKTARERALKAYKKALNE